jgi:hypothetical protein
MNGMEEIIEARTSILEQKGELLWQVDVFMKAEEQNSKYKRQGRTSDIPSTDALNHLN